MPAERTSTSSASDDMAASALGSAATKVLSSFASRPISGIFAINKPSGPTAMSLLDDLKPLLASSNLFASKQDAQDRSRGKKRKWRGAKGSIGAPKVGQGGTLDPLADGVLVIGIGQGTKHLKDYLDCTKEYRTTGLLGSATASYDNQDAVVERAPHSHVTKETLLELLPRFTGPITQLPPVYSAIRMDGKRLFEYAREGIPLPRPIEGRQVRVDELRLVDFFEGGKHDFSEPEKQVTDEERKLYAAVSQMAASAAGKPETETQTPADAETAPHEESEESSGPPPAFTLEMTVSSGTYVRSIVHDLGQAAGSAAHVQRLTRTRQGEWSISSAANLHTAPQSEGTTAEIKGNCIQWAVFADALADLKREQADPDFKAARDDENLTVWEREVLRVLKPVSSS